MKSKRSLLTLFLLLTMLIPFRVQAEAQESKTYAVLPFEVHGSDQYRHLRQGVQSMLNSRLHWEDRFLPVDTAKINAELEKSPSESLNENKIRTALGADYLVLGSITILGEQTSLDVKVQGPKDTWSKTDQGKLDDLIPALERLSKEINKSVFHRPVKSAPAEPAAPETSTVPINPDFIPAETDQGEDFYLNPDFRYSGATGNSGKIRSQSLPFTSMGAVAGDADNDGITEIFFLEEHKVHAFVFEKNKLRQLDTYEISHHVDTLNINLLDTNRDGHQEIIVSAIQEEPRRLFRSFMLNLKDGKFTVFDDKLDMFLNVVKTPPEYQPTLVGQRPGWSDLFDSPVYEIIRMSGEFTTSRRVSLPPKTNVFNFAYLPQKEGYKLITVDTKDRLRMYNQSGSLQHTTMESFAGSSIGLKVTDTLPGLGEVREAEKDSKYYYLPLRLVTANLNNDEQYELLVNKNISLASQFFGRYRSFPQGEIHSLYWDGVGLNLLWKTRRIKGTVVDYGIADVNNDGQRDLYVCIDSYPGASGFRTIRTFLEIYPLDAKKIDPNTPVDPNIDE